MALEQYVVVELLVDTHRVAGECRLDAGGHRQRLVVHRHQLDGVLCDVGTVGQHHGNRLADETHFVDGDDQPAHVPVSGDLDVRSERLRQR